MTKPEVVCRIDWNKDYNRGRREGLLEAYRKVLVYLKAYKGKDFSEVINANIKELGGENN